MSDFQQPEGSAPAQVVTPAPQTIPAPPAPVPAPRRPRSWARRIAYGAAGLVLLAVAALAGAWWYVGRTAPDYGRGAAIAGLAAPVEVWRDSLGVPHVWAGGEADLFRAMGYVHAQDRLWQMELFRRMADGRMAEVMGAALVPTDRFMRTLGMGRAAAETERTLDGETRALLQAYADGVNAWIRDHTGPLPPEFLALRFKPEPWTVRNSLSVGKIMAWDLADWQNGLELQRATDAVGPELAADLYDVYPAWGITTLGAAAGQAGVPSAPATQTQAQPVRPTALRNVPIPELPEQAAWLLDGLSAARASNAWVVGGERTRSGKPILANDTHLALRAPGIWFLAALHGGGVETAGMTIPGIPLVVIGHGKTVAWGFTNAMTDDVDFFVEQVDSADPTRYRTETGWAPFQVREERILVRGAPAVTHRVRTTRHGPVLSDVERRAGDRVLAMRWTGQDPSTEVRALLGMNRARNAAEFTAALRGFDNPHQNVVFADAEGNIGYWMAGRVPIRASGDGVLPVPGWTGEGAWTGWLGFDQHPHVLNPPAGFIVSANNRPAGADYPHRIASHWAAPYRAQRIHDLVAASRGLTAADVARQQMDVQDGFAQRYLPHAVRAAERIGDAGTARLLREWNGEASVDSRAATVFYGWYELLRTALNKDNYQGKGFHHFPDHALAAVLERGESPWVDDVTTPDKVETLDELSAVAMRDAARSASVPWGQRVQTRMDHPLGSVAWLERVFKLNVGPFPAGGAHNTVNVSAFSPQRLPYVSSFGPSQRHVVDLARVDEEGGFIVPTGQSGVPTSPHYRDQVEMWRAGRLWPIPLDRARAEGRAVHRMTLTPAR
ncbi:MAG TPA: penicillin acylase family protein [Longimicrobium sp.]